MLVRGGSLVVLGWDVGVKYGAATALYYTEGAHIDYNNAEYGAG